MSLWRRVYQERRAVVLPLLLLLAANVAVLVLGVFPLTASVASLQNEARDASTNLLRARLVEKQATDASGSKQRADQELRRFYAGILPANPTAARRVISFLQRTAGESGLVFQRIQQEESDVKDSQLERMSARVTLAGEYQNIRKYLYAVETAQEFIVIERVGLSEASDMRSANSGRLEVTLDVATYYLPNTTGVRPQ
jgi:Tfp pilus assembly protein PilO